MLGRIVQWIRWRLFLREPLWVKFCDCRNGCDKCRVELP